MAKTGWLSSHKTQYLRQYDILFDEQSANFYKADLSRLINIHVIPLAIHL